MTQRLTTEELERLTGMKISKGWVMVLGRDGRIYHRAEDNTWESYPEEAER